MDTTKRLDTGLIIITEYEGQDVALLMRRTDDPGTKDCAVTLFGMKRPTPLELEKEMTKMDFRFVPLIENACALFGSDFGHELGKRLGKAVLVAENETPEFHLQLFALRYDVPHSIWPSRTLEVTRDAQISVRQNDESDLGEKAGPIFMAIHGAEALQKAFEVFPERAVA